MIQIQEIIDKRLKPNSIGRHKRGEVFTPLQLAKEIVDYIPESIWQNPKTTFLDPAGGIGNFLVVVFEAIDIWRPADQLCVAPSLVRYRPPADTQTPTPNYPSSDTTPDPDPLDPRPPRT